MKKLLLLTAIPVTGFFYSFAGKSQSDKAFFVSHKDSLVKEAIVRNPREGFKDLFETGSSSEYTVKLNPQAISFVEDYMDKNTNKLTKMKGWSKPYFDLMDRVLVQHGIPTELKYLSVIESDLKSNAVSWAGAVGPWQFMPETGRRMGLRVTKSVDDRTDYHKSTVAAAKYLTYLYNIYNDWLLVVAAYNCGPGNVNKAITKSGSRNFWKLQYHLPAESRNHVKKFIATHYIMEGNGSVATLTKYEAAEFNSQQPNSEVAASTEVISVSGKFNSLAISQHVQMEVTEFNRLNPNFDKQLSTSGSYNLRLPAENALLFQAKKPQILEQSVRMLLSAAVR